MIPDSLKERFFSPVSGQSLAMFRIMFGFLIVWDIVLDLFYGEAEIRIKYIDPDFHLKHPLFQWVEPWPELWMAYVHYLVLLIAGIGVMLGWYYRVAIVAVVILFSYIFFIEMAFYLNHYYLMIVLGILLAMLPANREWSVDGLRHPEWKSRMVPHWSVWSMRSLIEVVLLYAGFVKLNSDWLRLEPLGMWLRMRADWHFFRDLVFYDWFIALGAYGTIALHLLGAPLLLIRKTRLAAFFVYCAFHLMNSYTFDIGIFPFMAIFATLIFFPADWPTQFYNWTVLKVDQFKNFYALKRANKVDATDKWQNIALGLVVCFLIVQILLPLRPLLYPGNANWTQEGAQFSWRMKLFDARPISMVFRVRDPVTGQEWNENPKNYLSSRQRGEMSYTPPYALQFARYLEKIWASRGYPDVEVYATIYNEFNGREPALYLDPNVDLTKAEWGLAHSPWVLPLDKPLLHWKEKKQRQKKEMVESDEH